MQIFDQYIVKDYNRKSHIGFRLVPVSMTLNDRDALTYRTFVHRFSGMYKCRSDVEVNENRPVAKR